MIHGRLNPRMQNQGYGGPPMGLEHPWILVSATDAGTSPPQILTDDCTWGMVLSFKTPI